MSLNLYMVGVLVEDMTQSVVFLSALGCVYT